MATILVINPNSSVAVTQSMERCLAPVIAATRHSVICTELAKSPPGIETDAHVAEVIPHLLEAIGAHSNVTDDSHPNGALGSRAGEAHAADAYVLGCFSDPGIDQLRQATLKPVIGIAEAAYLAALGLGRTFGIVSLGQSSIVRHRRYLEHLSLERRLAGDRSIDMGIVELVAGNVVETVVATGRLLRDQDGAASIILGCAGLGSYRSALEAELGIPVIDPVQAGVALAAQTLDLNFCRKAS